MTKIAFGIDHADGLRERLAAHAARHTPPHPGTGFITTRYLPKRHEEMIGGSLYWIIAHTLVGRSPILGFDRAEDGRWHIRIEPHLIAIHPRPRRAHQGWRYLADEDAPADLADGAVADAGEAMPGRMVNELARLGLV